MKNQPEIQNLIDILEPIVHTALAKLMWLRAWRDSGRAEDYYTAYIRWERDGAYVVIYALSMEAPLAVESAISEWIRAYDPDDPRWRDLDDDVEVEGVSDEHEVQP